MKWLVLSGLVSEGDFPVGKLQDKDKLTDYLWVGFRTGSPQG